MPDQMAMSGSRSRGMRSLVQTPQLSEDLWTKIGQHLTVREWAKAAGTCSAAWGAHCSGSMDIMEDLSIEGILHIVTQSNKVLRCKML